MILAKIKKKIPFVLFILIGLYAHSAERDWESNQDIRNFGCDDNSIDDIAEQLVHGEVGSKMKVIFGGGRDEFFDITAIDEEKLPGRRTDKKNLIDEWLRKSKTESNRTFIWNKVAQSKKKKNEMCIHIFIILHLFLFLFTFRVNCQV